MIKAGHCFIYTCSRCNISKICKLYTTFITSIQCIYLHLSKCSMLPHKCLEFLRQASGSQTMTVATECLSGAAKNVYIPGLAVWLSCAWQTTMKAIMFIGVRDEWTRSRKSTTYLGKYNIRTYIYIFLQVIIFQLEGGIYIYTQDISTYSRLFLLEGVYIESTFLQVTYLIISPGMCTLYTNV